ncbi:MAG: hypothetical protein VXZ87_00705 [Bacteroidota bacterium]|nr:hypothetical protein [Bacteroidota bacterium]
MKRLESTIRGLINEETITEGGHHDVISAKNQIKIARDALDKMERGLSGLDDEGSLHSWWTNKVAIAIDKLDGMADYLSTQIDEEAISESKRGRINAEYIFPLRTKAAVKSFIRDIDAVADRVRNQMPDKRIVKALMIYRDFSSTTNNEFNPPNDKEYFVTVLVTSKTLELDELKEVDRYFKEFKKGLLKAAKSDNRIIVTAKVKKKLGEAAINEATQHIMHVNVSRTGFRKLEAMIASLDGYRESDYSDGKARFYFDAKKHDSAEHKKVEEFIKKTRGAEFSHAIDEEAIRENLQSMDNDKAKDIYDKLRKGSIVEVKIGNAIASQLKPIRLVVTSGHRIVGKSKVGRILLVDVENPRGMKYKLFDRDGTIRLAQSDMATILKDMKIVKK